MEYSLQNLSKTKVEISFSVNAEEWDKDVKDSYNKNKHKYSLEGFRKGKVPMNILVKRYGIEFFYEEALDDSLNRVYGEILDKEKLDVVSRPEVDIKEVSKDGVKATITVTVRPEATLGQYTGLTITRESAVATDEEIENAMKREQDKRARLVTKDGKAADGDTVVIDYSGSVDGVKFEGGTAEKYSLALGSHSFIPGFEEQLVGMKAGDEKDIEVTFPENYTAELAGKKAIFAIKMHEVQVKQLPEIDDEFVKDIDDELNTVAEWKEKLAKSISDTKKQNSENKLESDIIDAIINNSEMEIPDCMVDEEVDYRIQELEMDMKRYGLKFADYLKYTGTTVEKLKEEQRPECLHNIKARLVIEAVCKKESLTVKAEEVKAKLDEMPDKESIQGDYVSRMANEMLVEKLFTFLKENNNIVEEGGKKPAKKAAKKETAEEKTEEKPAAKKKTTKKKED